MITRINVSLGKNNRGRQCLRFQPAHGEPFEHEINRAKLESTLETFHQRVDELIHQAIGRVFPNPKPQPKGLLASSQELSTILVGHRSMGAQCRWTQALALGLDGFCAKLPWELLHDGFWICLNPDHGATGAILPVQVLPTHCDHEERHEVMTAVGPLSLTKELAVVHHDSNQDSRLSTGGEGLPRRALVIGSPSARSNSDELPDEAGHLPPVFELLERRFAGQVDFLVNRNATRRKLVNALENPEYSVIYIYAHGRWAKRHGRRAYGLRLANGESLTELELPKELPGRPTIFLNSCWAGEEKWSETTGARESLAAALMKRGATTVIAPSHALPAHQAGVAAMVFFYYVVSGASYGQALHKVRQHSYERYCRHEPEVVWFAYRLYGDPRIVLPNGELASHTSADGDSSHRKTSPTPPKVQPPRGKSDPLDKSKSSSASKTPGSDTLATQSVRWLNNILPGVQKLFSPWITLPSAESGTASIAQETSRQFAAETLFVRTDISQQLARELQRHQTELDRLQAGGASREEMELPRDRLRAIEQLMVAIGSGPSTIFLLPERMSPAIEDLQSLVESALTQMTFGLPARLTLGATILVHLIRVNAVKAGPHASLPHIALASVLDHPLVNSQWVLPGQESLVRNLKEFLLTRRTEQGTQVETFLTELLSHAREIAGRDQPVNERILYVAVCQRAGWRLPPPPPLQAYAH